ncbi:WD40-repeat-containing domain-containing protein [Dioscorea alata]|uniref:WD40-repeat-containing domain-containing protein n=1 Tax=Dioscorea alata TaxID=55571 RepID=A0ACB7V5K1_DIOAL|nr:WD40-repeat-containing domain-containing protein [Dioscorea alata]
MARSFLLLLLISIPFASPDPVLLDRYDAQLRRLESLVDSLSHAVARLESSLASPAPIRQHEMPSPAATGVAVTKLKPAWSDRFQFSAAARLESDPTCAAVLPYEDPEGISKYFAVGDSHGRVYVFSSSGDVLMELPSPSDSPVTAMLSYLSSRRNDSLLFAGHADGSLVGHRLSETIGAGDEWPSLSVGNTRPFVRAAARELDSPPVLGLELHQAGRARYVLASDAGGRIRVFTENGTLYGTAIASSRPLAFAKHRLLFLTETGAGSLDLRSMVIREVDCEGLNGTLASAYSFDVLERAKAYGFTSGGDLIHVVLLGDVANLKCRVRAIRKAEVQGPVCIQAIRGYLLAVSQDNVFVYNVSSQYYGRAGAPRPLFSVTIQEVKSLFLNSDSVQDGSFVEIKPLIAADREKLVVLGLGGGYIGIYRSNFPVFKAESNAVVWSAPSLLFLLFLIGIWQFYVKKKDSLGWVPEDSFNTTGVGSSSGLLSTGATDRAFGDASRPAELRDLRGGTLRGPSRRYVSPPSRYPGGSGIPYRPASADPGFRGPSELKYRAQSIEPSGFAKRREPLFPAAQVSEDHID